MTYLDQRALAKTNRSSIIEKELRDPKRHGLTQRGRGRIVMGSVVVDAEGNEAVFLWVQNGRPQLTTPDLWQENEPQYRRQRTQLQVKNYQPGLSRQNPVDQWEYVIVYSDEGKSGTKQYERFITRKSPGDWLREAVRGDDQEQGNEEYGRNFRQGAPGEWHTQYADGTGRTWYISILPHSDRSRWALKARRNPMEWILVDVDPVRLAQVIDEIRANGYLVSTRKTTEGRKEAVGVSVDIPRVHGYPKAWYREDIKSALSWAGTIVGSAGHPTGDRSWATGPKKYTPRVQSPREMAHRGKVAANDEKRGKYSSKPKSKRPWQARNNPSSAVDEFGFRVAPTDAEAQIYLEFLADESSPREAKKLIRFLQRQPASAGYADQWVAVSRWMPGALPFGSLLKQRVANRVDELRPQGYRARPNGPTFDRPHYPFVEKEEQYKRYSRDQLFAAADDAIAASRAQQGWKESGANWYLDDYHTITKEIRSRKGSQHRAQVNPKRKKRKKPKKPKKKTPTRRSVPAWNLIGKTGGGFHSKKRMASIGGHRVEENPHYAWMPLNEVEPFIPLMEAEKVSEVARSPRGFLTAYRGVGGDTESLGTDAHSGRDWARRRDNFIARHMGQITKRSEPLWDALWDNPSRRHLALIAWAYTPDPDGVNDWLKAAKFRAKSLNLPIVRGHRVEENPTARPNFFWGKGAKAAATSDDPVYRINYEVWKRPYGVERGSKKLAASKLAEWYHGTLAQPDVAGLRIKSASGGSGGDPLQAIGQLVGVSAKALNNPARRNAGRQPSQYEHEHVTVQSSFDPSLTIDFPLSPHPVEIPGERGRGRKGRVWDSTHRTPKTSHYRKKDKDKKKRRQKRAFLGLPNPSREFDFSPSPTPNRSAVRSKRRGYWIVTLDEKGDGPVRYEVKAGSKEDAIQIAVDGYYHLTRSNPRQSDVSMYQDVLAHLRALQWVYTTTHWTSAGPNSYGDHLLLERLYTGLAKPIDGLGERMVAYFGPTSVHPRTINALVQTAMFNVEQVTEEAPDYAVRPLSVLGMLEFRLQDKIKTAWKANQDAQGDEMSLGIDDFLMSLANERDEAVYLLKQRLSVGKR